MSHDRGCWQCGREPFEYFSCTNVHCIKKPYAAAGFRKFIPQSFAEDFSVSKEITKILKDKNIPFKASDNISMLFTNENNMRHIETELTEKFEDVLRTLIIDVDNDPNSKDTAKRLAKMYLYELFAGRYEARPDVASFPNEGENKYTGLLVIRAEITSVCAHHHQPVKGNCYIGIIPNGKVIGLSKYIRLAQWCAKRGTLQEELCNMITKEVKQASSSNDVGVHISATHGCVENRGVKAHSSLTQTTVLSGQFNDPDVKKEFFDNITLQEMHSRTR